MLDIYKNIKKQRLLLGLTQTELAQRLGYADKSMIAKIEKGQVDLTQSKIVAFAEALNVEPGDLMGWESQDNEKKRTLASKSIILYNLADISEKMSEVECKLVTDYWELDEYGKKAVNAIMDIEHNRCVKEPIVKCETVLKPCYESSLSAGTGSFVFDDVPSKQIEIPIDFKDIDFVISVRGDSMEPSFFDGERVMIKKQHEILTGEIGAFMVNGEAFIKELGENRLLSHNKKYAPIQFNESMRIDCIGKVIGKL